MAESTEANEMDVSFGKGVLIAFGVLSVIISWIVFGNLVLGLGNPWVGLVALTTFGAAYQNNLDDAPKIWVGSAVALLIGWLLWYVPEVTGSLAGALVGLLLIVVALGAFIAQKFPLVCNFGMFMMLTVATASSQIMDEQNHLNYFGDLAYGAVCFWLLPWAIVNLRARMAALST